ncbi:MAG: PqqD family protein [Actinomycetota bacterium]|nr:PqqD family protein [Actinomycetota bacterium]
MGDTTTATTRPQARADLTVVELDGEAIIYDAEAGQLHRLNTTGRIVFSLCDGSSTTRELAADIAEAYGLPFEDVETHVTTLVADLQTAGLMERSQLRAAGAPLPERPAPPAADPATRHLHASGAPQERRERSRLRSPKTATDGTTQRRGSP